MYVREIMVILYSMNESIQYDIMASENGWATQEYVREL